MTEFSIDASWTAITKHMQYVYYTRLVAHLATVNQCNDATIVADCYFYIRISRSKSHSKCLFSLPAHAINSPNDDGVECR